jgi:hypothetical protein
MADERPQGAKVVPGETDELPETTLDEIVGCTGYRGPVRSLEEMEEAIEREAIRVASQGRRDQ